MPSERARFVHQHRDRLLRLANVVGCGWGRKRAGQRDTGREGLVVFVREKLPVSQLQSKDVVPRQVGGVETDVLEVGDVRLLASPARRGSGPDHPEGAGHRAGTGSGPDVDRRGRFRPAPPGVSIGHVDVTAGTLGAVVRDAATGAPYILSNNHVLANQSDGSDGRARIGDAILQPGPFDDGTMERDVIGHLARFVPMRPAVVVPGCRLARTMEALLNVPLRLAWPRYELRVLRRCDDDNVVDAAVVKPARADFVTDHILGVGRVQGMAEAEVGMKVCKSGRTSGVTRGEVVALGATMHVGLAGGVIARFADQIVTTPLAEPGDSGSLVLDQRRRAVGLLFAGSEKASLCNRIQAVCEALDVRF